jgi:hypothetical protein
MRKRISQLVTGRRGGISWRASRNDETFVNYQLGMKAMRRFKHESVILKKIAGTLNKISRENKES